MLERGFSFEFIESANSIPMNNFLLFYFAISNLSVINWNPKLEYKNRSNNKSYDLKNEKFEIINIYSK